MTQCIPVQNDDGTWTCSVCGYGPEPKPFHKRCGTRPAEHVPVIPPRPASYRDLPPSAIAGTTRGITAPTPEEIARHEQEKADRIAAAKVKRPKGPGDYLHETIKYWTGEDIERGCQCKAWIDRMNAWGPSGCREHLDEIVTHMLKEAKKRGWKLAGMPGAKTVAGLAVKRACRMAEKAEAARAN